MRDSVDGRAFAIRAAVLGFAALALAACERKSTTTQIVKSDRLFDNDRG